MRKHDNDNKITSNQRRATKVIQACQKSSLKIISCRVRALYVFHFIFIFAAEISVRYAFHNLPSNVSAAEYFRGVGNRAKYCNTIAKNKILFLWYGHGTSASQQASRLQPATAAAGVFGRVTSVWCGMFVVEVRLRNVVCLCLLKVARKRTCVIATTMQGRP